MVGIAKFGKDNPFYGKTHNNKTKEIMRLAKIGKHVSASTDYLNQLIKKGNVPDSVISTMNKIYIDVRMHYESNK